MILLEMMIPQLSMPEATAASKPKLHQWQNGEKTLGETKLSRGGQFPSGQKKQ